MCNSITELCKRVNQLLLLQSLYESKNCDSLLEPDDSPHNDAPANKNSPYGKVKGFDRKYIDLHVCYTGLIYIF